VQTVPILYPQYAHIRTTVPNMGTNQRKTFCSVEK